MKNKFTNALVEEISPYLLQHAHNPVDWMSWNAQTLKKAQHENKPILLSIGYSACHWCHVMAHESFEDIEVAEVMNRHFINIKVDKEERPDLDKIYQLSLQMLTQKGGGWPLTMFLNPKNLTPFYGGTYFPKVPRYGLPSFIELMKNIDSYFKQEQDQIEEQNKQLLETFTTFDNDAQMAKKLTAAPLDAARQQLGSQFDKQVGGFSKAPKFPHPMHIDRLLRRYAATKQDDHADEKALYMASLTLTRMAFGGIYDQLGGGFSRYSVDEYWMIPHFEKMLYDNAQLLALYADAWAISGNALYKRVVLETAAWVMRDMQSESGGYYSAIDADSEGVEGRYYVWQPQEVKKLLTKDEYLICEKRFALDQAANFEEDWHLYINCNMDNLLEATGLEKNQLEALLLSARNKLLVAREQRNKPHRDEKKLCSWNALMIRSMAIAARYFEDVDMINSCDNALSFVQKTFWDGKRLKASCLADKVHLNAYLDDYVFLIDALLERLQMRWSSEDLIFAQSLADAVLQHFFDTEKGGFFFTSEDHETLIHRFKPYGDDAMPAGNGIAAQVFLHLGYLLGETRYIDAAEITLRAAWSKMSQLPYAHDSLLTALQYYLRAPEMIVLRGKIDKVVVWQQRCFSAYAPQRYVVAIPDDVENLPEALAQHYCRGDVVAYICKGMQCSTVVDNFEEFDVLMKKSEVSKND